MCRSLGQQLRTAAKAFITLALALAAAVPLVSDGEVALAAAHTASALHNQSGGFTYSLRRGNLAGANAYAVAVFPERSSILPGRATEKQIAEFIVANFDLLQFRQFSAGGWYDRATHHTFLDISAIVHSRELAVDLGHRLNQKAVFSLRTFQEIETGGDGTPATDRRITAERARATARHLRFQDWRFRVRDSVRNLNNRLVPAPATSLNYAF